MSDSIIPKFEWKIDEEELSQGVKVISLVDEPAMESDYVFFSKVEKLKEQKINFVSLEESGYKQVVMGLAMIPDKEILRVETNDKGEPILDKDGNKSYYVGYFSSDTIEEIRNKFHKEQQTSNVNTDHVEDAKVDAYLIESFIINSEKQIEDLNDKGIKEAKMGSWVVSYKIEDEEVFNRVVEGELNGFSVEIFAERILKSYSSTNKFNEVNKLEKIMNKFFSELKGLIEKFEDGESQKFIQEAVPELNIIVAQETEEWVVGEPIYSVVTTEDGEEEKEPLADGEYELESGVTIVVAEGALTEIKPADESSEDTPSEETPSEEALSKKVKLAEDGEEEEEEEGEPKEEEVTEAKDKDKKLEELIDLTKDGYYTVDVIVENGAITYGGVYANTYKELTLKAEEAEKLKAEVTKLKKQLKQPIADPVGLGKVVDSNEDNYFTKENIAKYGENFLKLAKKNKLPLV